MKKLTTKEIKKLQKLESIKKLIAIIEILRDPLHGCPWDLKQSFSSLSGYPIEESYELKDAIDKMDITNIKEELGDLLLQIILFSKIGEEKSYFNFEQIAETISQKLIRRHPQIFDRNYTKKDLPHQSWEKIKLKEKNSRFFKNILDDIPKNFPPLLKSYKMQIKASTLKFDWKNEKEIIKKIEEELFEVKQFLKKKNKTKSIEQKLGNLMFKMIALSRHLGINPDQVLSNTNKNFENKFSNIEKKLYYKKINVKNQNILKQFWEDENNEEV